MKLKKVEIDNFGKLKGFSLEFSEGMNFVYGNNEDGKTTLMSFIKMMFYGNVGAARDLTNLRKKYRPWDGAPMGGAIEFEADGKLYRIQKRFGTTAGRDEVAVQCLTTGEPVQ
ncbi:MAG: AAA family ATPase, partial [Oscillospiraceae bacterium]|nr:AAA family ATPase [Oscillospiraceae bacterium]